MLKKMFLCLSLVALSLSARLTNVAAADGNPKPVAVLSFAGYDRLEQSLDIIGKLSGNPALKLLPEASLKMLTMGKGLAGLDKSRPWGVVVELDLAKSYAFLPVTDLKQLTETVEILSGKPLEVVGGAYKLDTPKQTLFAREQGKWAIVSATPESLANVPADPSAALGALPKQYDLAISLHVANVPPELLDTYLSMAQSSMEQATKGSDGEKDQAAQEMGKKTFESLAATVKDLEDVTLGLAIEPKSNKAVFDVQYTAKANSKFAAKLAACKPVKTQFAALHDPSATLSAGVSASLSPDDVEQILAMAANWQKLLVQKVEEKGELPDSDLKKLEQMIGDLFDVLKATVRKGVIDFGLAVNLKPGESTLIKGARVAEPAKLDHALRLAVQLASELGPHPEAVAKAVQLDAGKYHEFAFHKVTIPLAGGGKDTENLIKLVGDQLVVIVALGNDSVYVAAGKDPEAALKQAIDKSQAAGPQTVPPAQLVLSYRSIAQLLEVVGDEKAQMFATVLSGALAASAGKDHLRITGEPIERGVRVRCEVEEGLLTALGTVSKAMAGGAAPAP